MIPKKAIDQSLSTYLGDSARARNKLVGALDAEYRILGDSYSDNKKGFKDAGEAARKAQKKDDDRAYQRYQKRMATPEGGSFSDYEAEKAANKTTAENKIDQAQGHREQADERAEGTYKKRFGEIYSQHQEDIKTALDKLEAEHPGKGEATAD